MMFEARVEAVEALGFTTRQATFLTIVALHSGYCLRRQYAAFAGVSYGKNVRDFLDSLVARQLATRFTIRADRGHLYHLHARTIYRVLRQEHSRNRRQASAALIARKLMLLDYVLSRSEVAWAATEEDKLDLFAERFGIPLADLPQRAFAASAPEVEPTTRYFPHKLPVALAGDPPVVHFVSLVTDTTGRGLEQFIQDHASLLRHLPAWCVIAVGPAASLRLAGCDAVFERFLPSPLATLTAHLDDLRWYFATRQSVEAGDVARLSVSDIERFRRLRERFNAPAFGSLYDRWTAGGDDALVSHVRGASRASVPNVGRLVTEALPFDYSQFGSLPGVA
jgi:hypothetical protein